jgi:hypothetical protein
MVLYVWSQFGEGAMGNPTNICVDYGWPHRLVPRLYLKQSLCLAAEGLDYLLNRLYPSRL